MHSGQPQIINRTKTDLPAYAEKVLKTMFNGYIQVIIKSEFHTGFSGSRVFQVRPIRQDGAELPAVVKIDHAARIQQEWQAYQTYIQYRLPNVAEVRGEPVHPPGSLWGGLCYPLLGAGTFDVQSLHQYFHNASIENIQYMLETHLFKSLGTLCSQTRTFQPDVHLQTQYDSFLPVNLVIELTTTSLGGQTQWLHPSNANGHKLMVGDYVQVSGFQVVKVSQKTQTISLDMPLDTQAAYRMHLYPAPDSTTYEVGDVIHQPLMGIVRKTRQVQLHEQVAAALGTTVDLTAVTLTLTDGSILPNPLVALPQLLNHSFDAYIANIHGDLNLENILVDPESRMAYLIDFAQSRKDHILRDLFHLEMAVVTKFIASTIRENGLTPETICSFYTHLHCAVLYPNQAFVPTGLEKPFAILLTIRQAARQYLFNMDDWSEYFYGLSLYLLGSLRYSDLDQIHGAKATAFWATAVTLKLLQLTPPCLPESVQLPQSRTQQQTQGLGSVGTHDESSIKTTENPNIDKTAPKQENQLNVSPRPRLRILYSPLEIGLERLLDSLGENHARYGEALVYQQRLGENIGRARRFGDTSSRQAERAEIIEQLNELTLSSLKTSFNKLCQEITR